MHAQLSVVLRIHLRIFQLFGFFNISLNVEPRRQLLRERLLLLWTMLLLLFFSALTVFVFTSSDAYLFEDHKFGYFNDALKVCFAQLAVATIYVESLLRTDALREFWSLYGRLRRMANHGATLECSWSQWRQYARFLIICYGFVLCELVMSLLFGLLQPDMDRHVRLFWIMFSPYIYTTHQRCMQFLLHLEVMRHELLALAQDLNLLADYTRFAQRVGAFHGFEEFLRCKLRQKQMVYQRIYEMFLHFQAAFGCSIIAVLLMVYVRVLADTYFMYYITYRGWNPAENLLLLPAIFQIPAFLIISKNCMSVVKHITYQLHNILRPTHSGILSVQIQNFSLQILHEQIRIDGMGIGTLDGYMLSRAVGSIATYMLIFIQFMPKFKKLSQ